MLSWLSVLVHPFLAAAVVGGFVAWLWWYRYAQRSIPGPKGWPLIGCSVDILANWPRLHDWFLEHFTGTTKTFYLAFAYPTVGVYTVDPANVEYILKSNFTNYPKGDGNIYPLRELLGSGIFTTDGAQWKEQRRVASYEFSSASLRDFSTVVFREYAVKLVSVLGRFAAADESFDLQDLCLRMTLDSTCKIGFGVEMDCLTPPLSSVPFAKCFDDASSISLFRFADPVWRLKRMVNIGTEKRLKECVKVMDDFTFGIINKRRQEMAAITSTKPSSRSDLLSRFIEMFKGDSEDSAFTNKALRDMILNFVMAGRDTTASTLSWFFYMMICHPEVPHKIVEELATVTERPAYRPPEDSMTEQEVVEFAQVLTYEALGKLHYLQAALSETLRLYPAVAVDTKEAAEDDVLPDGTRVRKGNLTGYVAYSMGRMTALWGEDAAQFKPERWLKDGVYQPESPFKFTAFQAGPRTCLGKGSSYLQMKMTAALVLRFFSLHLVPGHPVHYRTMITLLLRDGLRVTATPRSSPARQ